MKEMKKFKAFVIHYITISLGAVLLLLGYGFQPFPKTLSGWVWLFTLAPLFCFMVGFASDIIFHYRPKNSTGGILWWRRVAAIALGLIMVAVSVMFFGI